MLFVRIRIAIHFVKCLCFISVRFVPLPKIPTAIPISLIVHIFCVCLWMGGGGGGGGGGDGWNSYDGKVWKVAL